MSGLTISQAAKALQNRSISATELTQECLNASKNANPCLNSFIHLCPEKALEMARKSDDRIAQGNPRPLEGIPIAVKDLFCTKGIPTSAASKILQNFVPPYESTVTQNLWQAGAVLTGKLNMDEFAMGSSNENSAAGAAINPWRHNNTPLTPGGSSGGAAAAVAAGLCPAAIATDTGGSIRQPASFTGTVGVKPTYGRASRYGIIAFASSLDQAGTITRNLEDAAILLQTICSHDHKDSTSIKTQTPDWTQNLGRCIKGLKIGIPKQYQTDSLPAHIQTLWQKGAEWLQQAGAEISEISLPHTQYALPAYYIIAPAEASSNLARYDGLRYGTQCKQNSLENTYATSRSNGFGPEVKRRILIGTHVLSAGYYDDYYLHAQKVRTQISRDFQIAFSKVDALLTPTTPGTAFAIKQNLVPQNSASQNPASQNPVSQNPVSMYLNDIFTAPASLAGLPACSVPAGTDPLGLPVGLQIIAPPLKESLCFQIGSVIENAASPLPSPEKWWQT